MGALKVDKSSGPVAFYPRLVREAKWTLPEIRVIASSLTTDEAQDDGIVANTVPLCKRQSRAYMEL